MPILLIRHATAGDPDAWVGDDAARPLDEQGRAQAQALVGLVQTYPIDRVLTSPYLRCVQTVEPLTAARALPLEYRHELGDDAEPPEALALIRGLSGAAAAVCSHGDLIRELLGEELEKGSVVVVESTDGRLTVLDRV
jgi:phosphohistidine phosphatase SixA